MKISDKKLQAALTRSLAGVQTYGCVQCTTAVANLKVEGRPVQVQLVVTTDPDSFFKLPKAGPKAPFSFSL